MDEGNPAEVTNKSTKIENLKVRRKATLFYGKNLKIYSETKGDYNPIQLQFYCFAFAEGFP